MLSSTESFFFFGLSTLLGPNQFESRNTELHLKLDNKINLNYLSSYIADFLF